MKILAQNKDALFNYHILQKYEAGLVLSGQEVKSVRQGLAQLKGGYINIGQDNQVYLLNVHIPKYEKASQVKVYSPTQTRKILLNKQEIFRIKGLLSQKGLTLLPLSLYSGKNKIKVEVGLCKSKKKADKKAAIKERDIARNTAREAFDYLDE